MTEVSKRILDQYQVRKSRKQKQAFIEFLQKYFPEMKIEYHKGSGSNNLILGNPARVVRNLTTEEVESIIQSANNYVNLSKKYKK